MPQQRMTGSVGPHILPSSEDMAILDDPCAMTNGPRLRPSSSTGSDTSFVGRDSSVSSPASFQVEQTSSEDETDGDSDSENHEPSDNTQDSCLVKGINKLNLDDSSSSRANAKKNSTSDTDSDDDDDDDDDEYVSRGPIISSARAQKNRSAPYPNNRGTNEEIGEDEHKTFEYMLQGPDSTDVMAVRDKTILNENFGNDYSLTPGNWPTNMPELSNMCLEQLSSGTFSTTRYQTYMGEPFPASPSTSHISNTSNRSPGYRIFVPSPEGNASDWNPDDNFQPFYDQPINSVLTNSSDEYLPICNSVSPTMKDNSQVFDSSLSLNGQSDLDDIFNLLQEVKDSQQGDISSEPKVLNTDHSNNINEYETYELVFNNTLSQNFSKPVETCNDMTDMNGSFPSPPQATLEHTSIKTASGVTVTYRPNFIDQKVQQNCDINNIYNSTTKPLMTKGLPTNISLSQPSPMSEHMFPTPTEPVRTRAKPATRKQSGWVSWLTLGKEPGVNDLMKNVTQRAAWEALMKMMDWKESCDAMGNSSLMTLIHNLKPHSKAQVVALVRKMKTKPETFSHKNNFGHDALYVAAILHPELPELTRFIAEAWTREIAKSKTPVNIQPTRYNIRESNDTLLHLVAAEGDSHANILRELLSVESNMFDVLAINDKGQTPLDVALECHSEKKSTEEIYRLLSNHSSHCDISDISLDFEGGELSEEIFTKYLN
ncbi:uncharacterized protein LOC124409122 [Diprion similis]|uniref:uncharacterized protein LOC124409122 n=1 Tax=Diprion similis TaxID=362088 RepID=UPI001EF78082|nr:uncharacterized protein LOC124409122 [Diprion similis]